MGPCVRRDDPLRVCARPRPHQRGSIQPYAIALPQREGRGSDHPALETLPCAGMVTIGGLALSPSTWKPATLL